MLGFFVVEGVSQDYTYSQFYANPLYLNPALAGAEHCQRMTLNYRNQWPTLPASFVSYSASYDQYSDFLSGGLGLRAGYNKSGEASINNFSLTGMYAYRLHISDLLVANFALEAGLMQRAVKWDELIFASRIDPNTGNLLPAALPPDNFQNNITFPDFATGFIIGYDEKYFIGGAVHHLNQPNAGFISEENNILQMKFTVHAGANLTNQSGGYRGYSNSSVIISPNILYQQQGDFKQLNVGTYFSIEPFVAGIWYRHAFENPDAIIISLGLHHNNLRFGYSYDYGVSALTNATGGAHEISLAWIFECDKKRRNSKAIKCPSF